MIKILLVPARLAVTPDADKILGMKWLNVIRVNQKESVDLDDIIILAPST